MTHLRDPLTPKYTHCGKLVEEVELGDEDPDCQTCVRKAKMNHPETILCAAIYVDTGKAEPPRRSYAYPETGLVFGGWRHGECFLLLEVWASRLTDEEKAEIEAIQEYQLRGRNQGFITSKGRYVDREEAGRIAYDAGQTDRLLESLTSEDVY